MGGRRSPAERFAAALAVGARWHGWCDDEEPMQDVAADGARIVPYPDEDSWHKAGVDWWIGLASSDFRDSPPELTQIPGQAALVDQAARGVSLRTEHSPRGGPCRGTRGGSRTTAWRSRAARAVMWVEPGVTELRWDVPTQVDIRPVAGCWSPWASTAGRAGTSTSTGPGPPPTRTGSPAAGCSPPARSSGRPRTGPCRAAARRRRSGTDGDTQK